MYKDSFVGFRQALPNLLKSQFGPDLKGELFQKGIDATPAPFKMAFPWKLLGPRSSRCQLVKERQGMAFPPPNWVLMLKTADVSVLIPDRRRTTSDDTDRRFLVR